MIILIIQRDNREVGYRSFNYRCFCWHLNVSLHEGLYLQHSNAPVFSSPLSCRLESRQANKGHSGGDGQRSNVLQQDPRQTQRSNKHLDHGWHDDSPLDLTEQKRNKWVIKQNIFRNIENKKYQNPIKHCCIFKLCSSQGYKMMSTKTYKSTHKSKRIICFAKLNHDFWQ